jgi:hypothetical protein
MIDDAPCQPDLDLQLERDIYYVVTQTLRGSLPPPIEDTPEGWLRRDRTAIATVASLVPVSSAEARLAAHHVAAVAHSDDALRQTVLQAADPKRVAQARAWSASMGREARGFLGSLLRLQAARQKREANDASRESAAWSERSTLGLMTQAMEIMPPASVPEAAPPAEAPSPPSPAEARPAARSAAPPAAELPPSRYLPPQDYSEWSEEEKRQDRLSARASRYAILNTKNVQIIRKLGRLPDNCDFEPPDPELLHEIIHGNHPNLLWADTYEPWQAAAQ